MMTLLQIFWTVCQWKKKIGQIFDEDIGKNMDMVSPFLTHGVCVYVVQTRDLLLKFPLHLPNNEGLCFETCLCLFLSSFITMLQWLQVIFIMLFIAEVDTRRIAYLCESIQEELKLESSYKKVWVIVWVTCKLCHCTTDNLWLLCYNMLN